MKLYTSTTSPYARKVRVVAHELSIKLEEINVRPRESAELRKFNPLGKIPTLILDDGSVLFESLVICEYLNQFGNGTFFPGTSIFRQSSGRWRAQVLHALADGLTDAAAVINAERRLVEPEKQNQVAIAHHLRAVNGALDMLERLAPKFAEHPTIGEIATGCALGFLDHRHADLDWRSNHPALAAWNARFSQYPSMVATAPKEQA
jgi:glutathione S-transferase